MTFKKWKPLWSYDIDKTEKWLDEMALKGYQLCGINRMTRVFFFENGDREQMKYQITYDKHQQKIPHMLSDVGWKERIQEGYWSVLENREQEISLFPSRDELVNRNRLHALIWKVLSILYGIQLFFSLIFVLIILISSGEVEVVSSPYWIFTIVYFLQVIAVLILTVTMTRKLREFERKYYDMATDVQKSVGKTFTKWKPNWMIRIDLTEQWLEEMAEKGNHLVKVQATRFVFEKGQSKQVAYVLDFQLKTAPSYTEFHKSTGWKLMYQAPQFFLKTTIWRKEYEVDKEKPQLIYEIEEKKAQKMRVVIAHGAQSLLMILMMSFALWNTLNLSIHTSFQIFDYFIISMITLAIILWLHNMVTVLRYAFKSIE